MTGMLKVLFSSVPQPSILRHPLGDCMIARNLLRAIVANACLAAGSVTYAQTMPPAADMKLAHDIYKQFIEIQSGYSTGSTTPVAEVAAARLKEAGFSESDIFLGGASSKKFNL